MKKRTNITTVTIIALFCLLCVPQTTTAQSQPYIEMQASVEREVTPDELYISITIKESDYKGKKTLAEMQEAMMGVLKINRIDVPECLSLDFMGSNVSYKVFSRRVIPRSQARFILKLSDAAIMQKVIYDLEDVGISNIELIETKYSKEDELRTEIGMEAMKKAQKQAIAYASAIGQEIGKAISVSSWASQNTPRPRLYKATGNSLAGDFVVAEESEDSTPVLSIRKLAYSVNVNIRFELK